MGLASVIGADPCPCHTPFQFGLGHNRNSGPGIRGAAGVKAIVAAIVASERCSVAAGRRNREADLCITRQPCDRIRVSWT